MSVVSKKMCVCVCTYIHAVLCNVLFFLTSTVQIINKSLHFFFLLGRLKVNMGNIYFKQKNYPKAIKFYRMALDQVPNTHKEMR